MAQAATRSFVGKDPVRNARTAAATVSNFGRGGVGQKVAIVVAILLLLVVIFMSESVGTPELLFSLTLSLLALALAAIAALSESSGSRERKEGVEGGS